MNLKYVFSIFILYCKDLLSIKFTKVLFSFLYCQIVLLITTPNKHTTKHKNKINIKNFSHIYNLSKIKNKDNTPSNKIKVSIIHLKNSTYLQNINNNILENKANFKILEDKLQEYKLPIFLSHFSIIDVFKGDIEFPKHITYINPIKNTLNLCSSSLILDASSRKSGFLYLDGYLEIDLTYSTPENNKIPLISKLNNYVIRIPFNTSIHINFIYPLMGNKVYFNETNISLKETKFTTDIKSSNIKVIEDCINLHKILTFSIIANYSIELYDFL
ncbi:hypothetical protein ACV3P9_11880 [Clostridium perfringens]|uniref:hypothetical protein n=1 Tax=Clostridium perfringens TaxID=1502 RepID=UPI002900419E|nr:hypothetical protein [Clostridium perfringens]EHA1183984.1 hypothetical protein [Clostridium perfringens]EJT6141980.1 hypothetical protein [Clostridium perfringens]MDK0535029.1 hypothetical protein [Clostridium perfringens]MDU1914254.1 hypothetical protein [Clostridium perfringens]